MKKRVLSALLTLCMMLTMAPVAFAGDVTVSTEEELKTAIATASSGDTIKLTDNIAIKPVDSGNTNFNPHITINKDLTLDLNGKKISWDLTGITEETEYTCTIAFFAVDGADVTITGNGTIDAEAYYNNSYGINIINGGNVTVVNGTYTGATTAIQVQKGTLTILDGTFEQAETIKEAAPQFAKYVINCIDSSFADGTARIYLKGGTYCYDFSNNPEGEGTSYVPVDYESMQDSDGKTWSVIAKAALTVEKPENVDSDTVDATVSGVTTNTSDDDVNVEGNTLFIDAKVESASNVTTSNITVGGTAISTISKSSAVNDVEIKTNVGTLTVSESALATIVENATTAGTTSDVTLSIEKTSAGTSTATYELTATDAAGNEVFGEKDSTANGTITVSVPAPSGVSDSVYVYYLGSDGAEKVEDAKVEGENVVWTVNHFSTYYITATEQGVSVTDDDGATKTYATLQEAINNAETGDTIKLLTDVTVNAPSGDKGTGAITIDKNITLDGNGNTIFIGIGFAATGGDDWDKDLGKYHVINILSNATIQNLTIDGGWDGKNETADGYSAARSGINIWNTTDSRLDVELMNVTVKNCSVYAVTAKGADLAITDLTTEGNQWGVNVEANSNVTIEDSEIGEDIVYESSSTDSTLNIEGGTYGTVKTQGSAAGSVQITEGANVKTVENGNGTSTNVAVSGSTVGTVTNSGSGDLSLLGSQVTGTLTNNGSGAMSAIYCMLSETPTAGVTLLGCVDENEDPIADKLNNDTVAIYNGKEYNALATALTDAESNGGNVLLVANAPLTSAVPAKTCLQVLSGNTLTVDLTQYQSVLGSKGTIAVDNGGVLRVKSQSTGDFVKMIGSNDANINLTNGYIEIGFDSALTLNFVGAKAEVPSGNRWTLKLATYSMNVTLDEDSTLIVTATGTADTDQNDGFRVANGSTLTNDGKVVVNGVMSISSAGKVDGSGTIQVSGVLVNNQTTANVANGITLASGGKVYSQADISSKLVNYRTLSNKTYNSTEYANAWEYYVSSGSSGGGGGVATYSVSTPSSVANGTISVSPKNAAKDATVTITVKPDDGYVLDTLTVTDASGKAVELTKKSAAEYTFKMPASKVTIAASFAEETVETTNPFTDIKSSDYYYDAVLWAVENGITNGVTATKFGPDQAVSRAQMVTFLWRAAGSPKATGTNPFADVKSSDYYYDAVLWAVANGVTNGTTETTFSPEKAVSRAQAVTFQWRAAGSPAASGDSFADVAADAYYADAVTWAVANEITNGMSATSFGPDVTVSRAQAVTFLYRAAN